MSSSRSPSTVPSLRLRWVTCTGPKADGITISSARSAATLAGPAEHESLMAWRPTRGGSTAKP